MSSFQEEINWFKTVIPFQLIVYLLCKINPYLNASLNIPTDFSGQGIFDTIGLLTGTIIKTTNIGWFNNFVLPIILLVNFVMVGIILYQLGTDIIPG